MQRFSPDSSVVLAFVCLGGESAFFLQSDEKNATLLLLLQVEFVFVFGH
jgi:hypothetical protein